MILLARCFGILSSFFLSIGNFFHQVRGKLILRSKRKTLKIKDGDKIPLKGAYLKKGDERYKRVNVSSPVFQEMQNTGRYWFDRK